MQRAGSAVERVVVVQVGTDSETDGGFCIGGVRRHMLVDSPSSDEAPEIMIEGAGIPGKLDTVVILIFFAARPKQRRRMPEG